MSLTRRQALRMGAAGALALGAAGPLGSALARAARLREADSLPDPTRAAGVATAALPFDHVVVLMMENHSFDCYFGMLPRRGQPAADGYTFDAGGAPVNSNPYRGGYVVPQHAASECQASVTQNWNSTHKQIDGGRMDGFANTSPQSMAYWTDEDLPFYYSLAKTFTLANRWFSSAPCQTYPNRRFLLAGTAYGSRR
jgi:phospholipase C